ncbi:MAG: hypothetical protein AAFR21_14690 [Pseudomonadota bacterium]
MSLLHVSISAREPERVAAFMAKVLGGRHLAFPPFPDSWIAFSELDDGSAIEVYPTTHTLYDGGTTVACKVGREDHRNTFAHVAVQSPLHRQEIIESAEAESWLARVCNRGPFDCVEVWLEQRLLVEVLDPEMQREYRSNMTMDNWCEMFGLNAR